MKLTCPHSGTTWYTDHGYGTGSAIHPATLVPLKKLVTQLPDYTSERILLDTDTPRYLYLLSWFNCLPSVTYRDPAVPARDYPALLACQDTLFKTVLAVAQYPRIEFPSIVVSNASPISGCLANWLAAIGQVVSDQKIRAKTQRRNIEVARMEETLDRITSHHTANSTPRAAKLVASWAAKVADFPTDVVTAPDGKSTMLLSDLWQTIIHQSFVDSPLSLLSANILPADLSELIEYCEDNIPHGTQHAYQLMKRLRAMESLLNELSGKPQRTDTSVGQSRTVGTTHKSQPENASAGTSINVAEPNRKHYPSVVAYLKARVVWQQGMLEDKAERAEQKAALAAQALQNAGGKYAEL